MGVLGLRSVAATSARPALDQLIIELVCPHMRCDVVAMSRMCRTALPTSGCRHEVAIDLELSQACAVHQRRGMLADWVSWFRRPFEVAGRSVFDPGRPAQAIQRDLRVGAGMVQKAKAKQTGRGGKASKATTAASTVDADSDDGAASDDASASSRQGGDAYSSKLEGHCSCVVCSSSSRIVSWAASKVMRQKGEEVPLGNLCEACFNVFTAKKNKEIKDVAAFVKKAQSSRAFRQSVESAKAVAAGKEEKTFEGESVIDSLSTGFELQSHFLALTERDLARLLKRTQMSRIPKYLTKEVPRIELPSQTEPGQTETHYIFRNPGRPYKEFIVKQSVAVVRDRTLLTQSQQLYAGHGNQVLSEAAPKVTIIGAYKLALDKAAAGNLMVLSDFVTGAGRKMGKNKAPNSSATAVDGAGSDRDGSGSDSDDDDDDGADSMINGPMADTFAASGPARSACSDSGKRLPPVPMFETPPSKRSRSEASPSMVGSIKGVPQPCDEEEGGDDELPKVTRMEGDTDPHTPKVMGGASVV